MTLKEAIIKSVKEQNAELAGKIADYYRFRLGANYKNVLEAFQKYTEITESEFEALMYEADTSN